MDKIIGWLYRRGQETGLFWTETRERVSRRSARSENNYPRIFKYGIFFVYLLYNLKKEYEEFILLSCNRS